MSNGLGVGWLNVMSHGAHWAGRLGLLVALAACGGGGGGGSTEAAGGGPGGATPPARVPLATSASRLFPLDSNGVAVYAVTTSTDPVVVRVIGTQLLADQQTATLIRRQDFKAGSDRYRAYTASEAGLRQYAAAGADAIERAFDGSYLMRWPAYPGDSHVQLDTTIDSGMDFDGDGRADRVGLRADVTVLGLETVTTPAGTFTNALHQQQVFKQTVHPSSAKPDQQLITTTDTWYAPGVGIVRQTQAEQGVGAGSAVTQELVKYRFGTQVNDTEAPSLQTLQPALGSQALPNAVVVATFNEEMDEASFTPKTFTLTDPAGLAVVGTLRASGRSVSFTPTRPLSTGTHRVNIGAAVQDLFGRHPTSETSSSFTVDATAPQVVSTWPAADALNVALNTTIGISLSEAPASASVNTSTVQLTVAGGLVPATVRATTTGIAIEPLGGLQRGTRYDVVVDGVTDAAGNPIGQRLRFGFETTPGRFNSPERVPAAGNGSIGVPGLATGDVNGDGLPDVVYVDAGDEGYPDAVYLRAGRADGQLDLPVRLNLSSYFQPLSTRRCPITALVIGDFTADGRPDVAVGSWNCGVLVLRQTASGGLEPGQFIDELIQVLRGADFNGDGRLDLVGVQNHWNKAFVWLQQPDGQLLLDQTPGLGDVAGRDVAVGDVDGDSRQDLVVALRAQDAATANIAILRQLPDGRFAPPRYLSTGRVHGVWGVAVGDFNGDGRLDIVGTTLANSPASLLVFLQKPDGSFPMATDVPTLDGAFAVLATDINGDGRVDVVVHHEGRAQTGIYLQTASGALAPEELYENPGRSADVQVLAVSDINRDGLPDIIAAGYVLRQVPMPGKGPLGAAMRAVRHASGRPATR